VAAGLASRCEVQLAYAIGVAEPVSVLIDTFRTGKLSSPELVRIVREVFDLRPKGIIEMLGLKRPIYEATAAYGHFGRQSTTNGAFSWERIDKADSVAKLATHSTVGAH
jgi:S-adenosylmethionine synthetase